MGWVKRIETAVYCALLDWPRLRRVAAVAWQAVWSIGRSHPLSVVGHYKVFHGCFFGFHDKNPWSPLGDYLAVHFSGAQNRNNGDKITLGVIDPLNRSSFQLATTRTWNWQQGAQLQWLNQDEFVFNDIDRRGYPVVRATSLNASTRLLSYGHLSALHRQKRIAAFSDYKRLALLLPGYGYIADNSERRGAQGGPLGDDAFYLKNLDTEREFLKCSFAEMHAAAGIGTNETGRYEAVSHFLFSPDGNALSFFYLRAGIRVHSLTIRLMVLCIAERSLFFVPIHHPSHYCWGLDNQLFVTHMSTGRRWSCSLFDLGSSESTWSMTLSHGDGHISYSPVRGDLLIDSYPDRHRIQRLMVIDTDSKETLELFSARIPLRYSGVCRCDFHPRWDEGGREICFDSAHTGERSLCILKAPELEGVKPTDKKRGWRLVREKH